MTTVTFQARGQDIVAVAVEGHSGYAEAGSDIVCAAVSAAVQLLETQLTEMLGIALDTHINEATASISLTIQHTADWAAAQPPLRAFARVARQWAEQYPANITVQEVTLC